jgi:hypothetical protein
MRKLVLVYVLFYCVGIAFTQAQSLSNQSYPQNYFNNPLGIPIQLSGNFGHLRKDHFHMGLDLRTQQKENLPVYAAATGYISRIKIEHYGYGRAIYITHNNGYTSVYGHLNNFYDTLNHFVKNKQYQTEKWEQDLTFLPNQFPVNKGQFIAFSGNTGGSQGPHLHFEIRENIGNTIRNINPLLFGFNVADHTAPRIKGLYWYDRRYSTYFTDNHAIALHKDGDDFIADDSVVKIGSNKISFGINADDKTDISPNYYGIYSAVISVDNIVQNGFEFNTINTAKSSYINGSIDYPFLIHTQKGIQHIAKIGKNILYDELLQKNKLITNPFFIEFKDTLVHVVSIDVKDIAGNNSNIHFFIQYQPDIDKETTETKIPYGTKKYFNTYYPDINSDASITNVKVWTNEQSTTLFDTALIAITQETRNGFPYASNLLHIGDYHIPVEDPYYISIPLDSIALKYENKLLVKLKNPVGGQTKKVVISKEASPEKINGKPKPIFVAITTLDAFGDVEVVIDTIPPSIIPVNFPKKMLFNNEQQIILRVADNNSGIKKFSAVLDGKWLMFSRKNSYFMYTFDEHCALGKHELKITVTDECGNTSEQQFEFTKGLPFVKTKYKKSTAIKRKKKSK